MQVQDELIVQGGSTVWVVSKGRADDTQIEYLNDKETNWIHFPFRTNVVLSLSSFPSFFEGRKNSLHSLCQRNDQHSTFNHLQPHSTCMQPHSTCMQQTLSYSRLFSRTHSFCLTFSSILPAFAILVSPCLHCITFSPRDHEFTTTPSASLAVSCLWTKTWQTKEQKNYKNLSHRIFCSRTTCMCFLDPLSS